MRHALVTTLENTPVIPAVKTPEELPAALRAEGGVVFLLCGDILNIGELIARVHAANRRAVVHADLVAGLAPREDCGGLSPVLRRGRDHLDAAAAHPPRAGAGAVDGAARIRDRLKGD